MLFSWPAYSIAFWNFGSSHLLMAATLALFAAGAVMFAIGWRRRDGWWDRWRVNTWSVSGSSGSDFKPAGCKHKNMRTAWVDGRQVMSCTECSYTWTGGAGVPREGRP